MTTHPYSDFLRQPRKVLPAVEGGGQATLERRDGPNLVLMLEHRFLAACEGTGLAARMMRDMIRRDPGLVADVLAEELPWVTWLPEDDRKTCLKELVDNLWASSDAETFTPFVQVMTEWRHTAEVWADPELGNRLRAPADGEGPELVRPGS
jgi:hypothetical protein